MQRYWWNRYLRISMLVGLVSLRLLIRSTWSIFRDLVTHPAEMARLWHAQHGGKPGKSTGGTGEQRQMRSERDGTRCCHRPTGTSKDPGRLHANHEKLRRLGKFVYIACFPADLLNSTSNLTFGSAYWST
jgi:hypothetical protein